MGCHRVPLLPTMRLQNLANIVKGEKHMSYEDWRRKLIVITAVIILIFTKKKKFSSIIRKGIELIRKFTLFSRYKIIFFFNKTNGVPLGHKLKNITEIKGDEKAYSKYLWRLGQEYKMKRHQILKYLKLKIKARTSLVVQLLRILPIIQEGADSIPDEGAKIPRAEE